MKDARWTEVNILPASARDPERLLTDVVDPLAHVTLRDLWDRWHFFWEPELRLRFRWREAASACRDQLAGYLDRGCADGRLHSWSETPYAGEAKAYGSAVWEAETAGWMAGSELALAVIKAGRRLPYSRTFYWERHEHLFANQLHVPEAAACLAQAYGWLDLTVSADNPRVGDIRAAIERYFGDDRMVDGELDALPRALARALARADRATQAP
jgi:hypothetical protein